MNDQHENNNMKFFIIPSANKQKAYLRVSALGNDTVIHPEDILEKLKELGISYGIDELAIKKYCENGDFTKELVAAKGKISENGIDAYISYKFDTSDKVVLKENADGSVNFKELNNIKSINKDDLICEVIPAKDGVEGVNIYSESIGFREGKTVELPNGNNVYASEDKLRLYASVNGAIIMKDNRIDVENIYTVESVGPSTGNINFKGSVVIKGDVSPGYKVKAELDIMVDGMVEGSDLEAGNDIVIKNGINGQDVSKIIAKGNITSKYLENALVEAGKSIFSNEIINCNVKAGENIILKGNIGAIIGGSCVAEGSISTKIIGTKNNLVTKVGIDLSKLIEDENKKTDKNLLPQLKNELAKFKKEKFYLDDKIDIISKLPTRDAKAEKLYKLLILKRADVNKKILSFTQQIEQITPQKVDLSEHRIICSGTIFANTHIEIGWLKYFVRNDLNYSKLYNDGSEIQISTLTSADLNLED